MVRSRGFFCQPNTFAEEHLLYPLRMGYISSGEPFFYDRKSFPGYLLMCCLSGRMTVRQYGESRTLSAGESCLMDLKDAHVYGADPEDPCDLVWVQFDGHPAQPLIGAIFDGRKRFAVFHEPELPAMAEKIVADYERDPMNACFSLSAGLYGMLMCALQRNAEASSGGLCPVSPLAGMVDRLASERGAGEMTLQELAEACHLAPAYFCRRFRAETGLSPMRYLMERRMQAAKYLLLYSDRSISSISAELGFSNQNHFSARFTRIVGMSPSEFRRKNASGGS